jgi:hypothetical protein
MSLGTAPVIYIYREAATPAWKLDTFGDARHSVLPIEAATSVIAGPSIKRSWNFQADAGGSAANFCV